ncbi:nicotinate-nucleotide adenylyltransferase [Methylonatrum kenyense]|uniref:nicotinate-nucleotide adenylyltransferase n=1 Tax=Methylonatrum kenyense TaxID=455253 RepID=UPI0020BFFE28|nr:nicotinate-nucleotide adenylyltransferase [Methylonatrum kenyense]MCK8516242.1 nicotinate-nucleotide adenylyltransferase [Methylonatrum kenyense]
MSRLLGLLGGTFDPVHNGHLRAALDVCEAGQLDQLRLLPCHIPPHRQTPRVDAATRLQLLQAAIHGEEPRLVVDDRELRRDAVSYTVDTLHSLHLDFPAARLCLLLGTDTFNGLPSWHRWRELGELAHLVVMQRPDFSATDDPVLARWMRERRTEDWTDLRAEPFGRVLFQPVAQLGISASLVRQRLAAGRSARYLVPEPVWQQIQQQQLYAAP